MAHGLVVLRPRFLVEASRLLLDGRKKRRKETRKEGRIPLAKDGRRLITPPGSFLPLAKDTKVYTKEKRESLVRVYWRDPGTRFRPCTGSPCIRRRKQRMPRRTLS